MRTALRTLLCVSTTKFKKGTRSGRRRSGANRSGGRPNEGTQFALSTQRAHSNVQRNGQLFCEQAERETNMDTPKGRIVLKILRSILDLGGEYLLLLNRCQLFWQKDSDSDVQ